MQLIKRHNSCYSKFLCFIFCREEPVLDWLLERGSPELGRLITSEDKTGLTIINVTASDEMLYYCMATNDQGSNTTDIALKIEGISENKFVFKE